MPAQPGANLLTQNAGLRPENLEVPHYDVRAPNVNDVNFPDGKRWLWVGTAEYVLLSKTSLGGILQANWSVLGTSGGTLSTITTQDSTVVVPVGGNINLDGAANELTSTGSGDTATIGFVAAVIFPGSAETTTTLEAGTTVTAGTGISSILGDITADAGDISATLGSVTAGTTVTAGTGMSATTGNITADAGNFVATLGDVVVSAGDIDVTLGDVVVAVGDVEATLGDVRGRSLFATGDEGTGVIATTALTNVVDTTQGVGALTLLSANGNSGTNAGFMKMYVGTVVVYVPYFTDITP